MAVYQSLYNGSEIDQALNAVRNAINSGGVATGAEIEALENQCVALDARFDSYSTTDQMNAAIQAKFPVNSVYITATNSNPASYLGGAWSLIDKDLSYTYVNAYSPTINSKNCTSASVYGWYAHHGFSLTIDFTPKVAIGDTLLEMFTINPNTFGLSAFPDTIRLTWFSDGGQAVISAWLNSSGVFSTEDVFVRNTSSPASVAAGTNLSPLNTYINVRHPLMLDAKCNKFYWKRTS